MGEPKPKPLRAAEVEKRVRDLLQHSPDDETLRTRLEGLAEQPAFPGLTWLWGPELYRRNRRLFRPFILSNFSTWILDPPRSFSHNRWTGELGQRLEAWLREADRADDVQLFRRLYQWKLVPTSGWRIDPRPLLDELGKRFAEEESAPERAALLQKFDLWFELDEPVAEALYRRDAMAAGPFVLRHLPSRFSWWGGEKRILWSSLFECARQANDPKTAFALYRRQIPVSDWEKDVLGLAETIRDPEVLCEELEIRHPEGWGLDLGVVMATLLEKRGLAIWPYLRRHLFQVRQGWLFQTGYDRMLAIARANGWWTVWAGLLRVSARPQDFNREIQDLVKTRDLPEKSILERLILLTGVAREWNVPGLGLAQVKPLDDPTALALYERFPDLLRGPFKKHLMLTYGISYAKTIDRLLEKGEDDLVDFLASRAITRHAFYHQKDPIDVAATFSSFFEKLRDSPEVFSRRAGSVLGQIPAFAIFQYGKLVRENRLARLLFERSLPAWLEDPLTVCNLVEAPEIHVQALAYRVLGCDHPDAPRQANANLPVLLGTLLRPLHRRTRIQAFGALENAATDEPSARLIVERARDAMDLPDTHYPKEKLLGLIARLLRRWPALRVSQEIPLIHQYRPGRVEAEPASLEGGRT